MTATFSERPDKAAPFDLQVNPSITSYGSESDGWISAEGESRHSDHPHPQWESLERAVPDFSRDSESAENSPDAAPFKPVEFALASEQEFARMLDARCILWQYKARTFAVDWDEEGNFVDCFTPDFYLPANDTYIALIAPDCVEANTKARSVKLLRRHHSEVRIEIVNPRYLRH